MDSGNTFDVKCRKCKVWYEASCHWYTMYDKDTYQPKDKEGNPVGKEISVKNPRVILENIEAHECKQGGGMKI